MLLAKITFLSLFPESKCWLGNLLLVKIIFIFKLCISNIVDLNGQEDMWQQWHELSFIESLGSSAKEGVM